MSTGYQIQDQEKPYYLTLQVVEWVDLPACRQAGLQEKHIGILLQTHLITVSKTSSWLYMDT
jgi:hypothetical protein